MMFYCLAQLLLMSWLNPICRFRHGTKLKKSGNQDEQNWNSINGNGSNIVCCVI